MRPKLAASIAVLVGVSACASPTVSLQPQPRSFTEASYAKVYDAWTRSEEAFSWKDLRHLLRVTATFESWEFRWAYIARYAHDLGLDEKATQEMLEASLARSKKEHRFFVSLVGDSFRESNLAGDRSAWRPLLIGAEGRQAAPIAIERIRRPTPAEQVYFPAVSARREVFRLTFPATNEEGAELLPATAKSAVLRFTGPRGKVDLRWNLRL